MVLAWNMFEADFKSTQAALKVQQVVSEVAGVPKQDVKVAQTREFAVAGRRQSLVSPPLLEVLVQVVVPSSRYMAAKDSLTILAISESMLLGGFEPPLSVTFVTVSDSGTWGNGRSNTTSGFVIVGGIKYERRECIDAQEIPCMHFVSSAILKEDDPLCTAECKLSHQLNRASQSVYWINLLDLPCEFISCVFAFFYMWRIKKAADNPQSDPFQKEIQDRQVLPVFGSFVTFLLMDMVLEGGALYHAWLMKESALLLLDNFCLASSKAGVNLVRELSSMVANVITIGAIELGVAFVEMVVELLQNCTAKRDIDKVAWMRAQVLFSVLNLGLTAVDFYFTWAGTEQTFDIWDSLRSGDDLWCFVALERDSPVTAYAGRGFEVQLSSGELVGVGVGAVFFLSVLFLVVAVSRQGSQGGGKPPSPAPTPSPRQQHGGGGQAGGQVVIAHAQPQPQFMPAGQ